MKRLQTLLFAVLVGGITLGGTGVGATAQAALPYTGAEEICVVGGGCGSGGGVFERNGRYYMMTVAHITTPAAFGADVYAYHPEFRHVGKLAYRSTAKDIALIDMGTTTPSAKLRVANYDNYVTPPGYVVPSVATISSVPQGADWAYYNSICTTGWSASSTSIRTKCGFADNTFSGDCSTSTCGIRSYSGAIAASVDAGASGSVVWQPKPDGTVRLLGFMSNCVGAAPCSAALFRPVYLFANHNWSITETAPGYAAGVGGQVKL